MLSSKIHCPMCGYAAGPTKDTEHHVDEHRETEADCPECGFRVHIITEYVDGQRFFVRLRPQRGIRFHR